MFWDELQKNNINVENITADSEEYQAMRTAAIANNPSAAFNFGLWHATVRNNLQAAQMWMRRAAKQNYEPAIEALSRLENNSSPAIEDNNKDLNIDSEPKALVIKEHDFLEAKNALKQFTERQDKEVTLSRVRTGSWFFGLGDHMVTGEELNRATKEIGECLIDIKNFNLALIDEFIQVYKAFEALDRDYIRGIVVSIKSAEVVSKKEQEDRIEIRKLIKHNEQAIDILKKFKADIDKLKHLTDIDRAWELIENQSKLIKNCQAYIEELSNIQHIKDIDMLWDSNESISKEIQALFSYTEDHKQAISNLLEMLQHAQEAQQKFIINVNRIIADYREDFNNQIQTFTETHTAKLNDIDRNYNNAINVLSVEQKETLFAIEKDLGNSLDCALNEQSSVINEIKKTQKEKYDVLLQNQSSMLDQIENDQSIKLEKINKSLEEEKVVLNEQVNTLSQKVKYLSIVAGGAAALTVIQLLLNIFGVI